MSESNTGSSAGVGLLLAGAAGLLLAGSQSRRAAETPVFPAEPDSSAFESQSYYVPLITPNASWGGGDEGSLESSGPSGCARIPGWPESNAPIVQKALTSSPTLTTYFWTNAYGNMFSQFRAMLPYEAGAIGGNIYPNVAAQAAPQLAVRSPVDPLTVTPQPLVIGDARLMLTVDSFPLTEAQAAARTQRSGDTWILTVDDPTFLDAFTLQASHRLVGLHLVQREESLATVDMGVTATRVAWSWAWVAIKTTRLRTNVLRVVFPRGLAKGRALLFAPSTGVGIRAALRGVVVQESPAPNTI